MTSNLNFYLISQLKLSFLLIFFFISCVFGQFLPINGAGDICYVSTSNRVWNFPQWESPPATAVVNMTNNDTLSFMVQFCSRVDVVLGNMYTIPFDNWSGWSHGHLESFTFTGDATVTSFRQEYMFGDSGFSCITGRRATVFVNCVGCSTGSCLNGTTDYCLCNVIYNPTVDPCLIEVELSMKCPKPGVPPSPAPPKPISNNEAYTGTVLAVIFIILLILSVTACVGGYAYNVKVQNKHGLPAVPGYDFCIGLGKKLRDPSINDPSLQEDKTYEKRKFYEDQEEKEDLIEKNYGTM